jgi:hypothetical protein
VATTDGDRPRRSRASRSSRVGVLSARVERTFATWTTVGGCAFGALLLLAATLLPERAVPHGRGAVALSLVAGAALIAVVAALQLLPAPFTVHP